jgi:hypothetical protein
VIGWQGPSLEIVGRFELLTIDGRSPAAVARDRLREVVSADREAIPCGAWRLRPVVPWPIAKRLYDAIDRCIRLGIDVEPYERALRRRCRWEVRR